jgi:hypothetical protein
MVIEQAAIDQRRQILAAFGCELKALLDRIIGHHRVGHIRSARSKWESIKTKRERKKHERKKEQGG